MRGNYYMFYSELNEICETLNNSDKSNGFKYKCGYKEGTNEFGDQIVFSIHKDNKLIDQFSFYQNDDLSNLTHELGEFIEINVVSTMLNEDKTIVERALRQYDEIMDIQDLSDIATDINTPLSSSILNTFLDNVMYWEILSYYEDERDDLEMIINIDTSLKDNNIKVGVSIDGDSQSIIKEKIFDLNQVPNNQSKIEFIIDKARTMAGNLVNEYDNQENKKSNKNKI